MSLVTSNRSVWVKIARLQLNYLNSQWEISLSGRLIRLWCFFDSFEILLPNPSTKPLTTAETTWWDVISTESKVKLWKGLRGKFLLPHWLLKSPVLSRLITGYSWLPLSAASLQTERSWNSEQTEGSLVVEAKSNCSRSSTAAALVTSKSSIWHKKKCSMLLKVTTAATALIMSERHTVIPVKASLTPMLLLC